LGEVFFLGISEDAVFFEVPFRGFRGKKGANYQSQITPNP
jgi:hypothetical protein